MKLLLLTQFWPPEYGPDQTILSQNMAYLRDHGVDVAVVAALPSYPTGIVSPAYRNKILVRESIEGIRTVRTWTYSGDRRNLKKRIANEVSFAASCFLALAALRERFDVVLTMTPPQETQPSGWLFSKLVGAKHALYVMDLMPEAALSLGMIRNKYAIGALRALARVCYRGSALMVAASANIKRGIEAYGIPPERVVWVPNGIDADLFRPVAPDPALREEFGLGDRFVAIFSGTLAYAHDLDTTLDVADLLQKQGDDSIAFVIAGGGGSDKERIRERARSMGLKNVHFPEPVDREEVPARLAAADVVLIPLRRLEVNRSVIPTKLYDAMACGRPTILAIEGDGRDLLLEAEGGITIEPENPAQLLAALRTVQADRQRARQFGENARRYVEENLRRERSGALLQQALESIL